MVNPIVSKIAAIILSFSLSVNQIPSDIINNIDDTDCVAGYSISNEEKEILIRIAEAEATGGTKEQKKNVMTCVMNRVLTGWASTIKGVVFQKGQFTPISDGRYYSVKIEKSTREAYDEWIQEGLTHDCIYFCSYGCKSSFFAKKGEPTFKDGIHRYYRK